jgi:integrase
MVNETTSSTRLGLPVLLTALTGLRRGEVLALRGANVNFGRRRVAITEAVEQTRTYGVRFKSPKSRSSKRVLLIADQLIETLQHHKARQEVGRKQLGEAYFDHGLVFCNEDGTPWAPDTFTKQFATIIRASGLADFRFHDVRHAFASITLKQGVSVKEVSALLGHSSPMLTLSTYARTMEGLGRQAVNGLVKSLLVPKGTAAPR